MSRHTMGTSGLMGKMSPQLVKAHIICHWNQYCIDTLYRMFSYTRAMLQHSKVSEQMESCMNK